MTFVGLAVAHLIAAYRVAAVRAERPEADPESGMLHVIAPQLNRGPYRLLLCAFGTCASPPIRCRITSEQRSSGVPFDEHL